jgi:hypothetical protein
LVRLVALWILVASTASAIESVPCEGITECPGGTLYVEREILRWCWDHTTGNPEGYDLEVSRDGSPFEALGSVAVNAMELPGFEGDTVSVRVRAWRGDERTEWSPVSCAVHVDPFGPPGLSWFGP